MIESQRETLVGSIAVDGERIFDDKFGLVTYVLGVVGLAALEVVIEHNGLVFTIEIETPEVYAERSYTNGPNEQNAESENSQPFLVVRNEILPSDLLAIKASTIDQLAPYLTQQI